MAKIKVLFLCTGNSVRSQMAEAFLRTYGDEFFEAYSAGLEPKGMNPLTVQVMDEIGVDIHHQTSKDLMTYLGKQHFGYLITVCAHAEANCPIFPGMGKRLHWSFDDPAKFDGEEAAKLAKFRQVRDEIGTQVRAFVEILKPAIEAG